MWGINSRQKELHRQETPNSVWAEQIDEDTNTLLQDLYLQISRKNLCKICVSGILRVSY